MTRHRGVYDPNNDPDSSTEPDQDRSPNLSESICGDTIGADIECSGSSVPGTDQGMEVASIQSLA